MSDAFHCPYCDDPTPHGHPSPVNRVLFNLDAEGLASLTNGDVERIATRVCDMLDERRMAACPIHGNEGCACTSGAECEVISSDGNPLMRFRRDAIARRASGYRGTLR